MTLEDHVFEKDSATDIARSVLRSATASRRRKTTPFRSAMSMLTFYVNRAGKNLDAARRAVLDDAKEELRRLAGREAPAAKKKPASKKKKPAARKKKPATRKKTAAKKKKKEA